ncbi:MAG: hypothetical protein K8U57_38375 [Planctomycetes bacterium]|nr:hypothetical protein [Planctomycetota bacterium]
MIPLCNVALILTLALGVILFSRYPGHRLVIGAYVLGMLFLPELGSTEYIEGVPPPMSVAGIKLTKPNVIGLGLIIGSLLYDRRRWLPARPRWFDLPMIAWTVGPVLTSVTNSLLYEDPVSRYVPMSNGVLRNAVSLLDSSDLYDGILRSVDEVFLWGVPYLLARLYITDARKVSDLILAIIIGAALYAPLCLLEMVVSPQLHRWVYGFHQHDFLQSIRFNGYRPMVFFQHGLALGFWMMVGALSATWLWLVGPLRDVGIRRGRWVSGLWIVIPLCLTSLLCRSTGALALGFVGFGTLLLSRTISRPIPVLVLLCLPPLYAAARIEGSWDVQGIVAITGNTVGADRGQSLEFRLENEDLLIAKAIERPLVGWGGWGRSRVHDDYGEAVTIADGLWIITFGERGLIGLGTLGLVFLLPVIRLLVNHRSRPWTQPEGAALAVGAVILSLYTIDSLLNAMLNPVYILLAGGLAGLPRTETPAPISEVDTTPRRHWRVSPIRQAARILRTRERPASRVRRDSQC